KELYRLFARAPVLGSLIDPRQTRGDLFSAGFDKAYPVLQKALAPESDNDLRINELAVAAQGLIDAAQMLLQNATLVATNVPYVGRDKQDPTLRDFLDEYYEHAGELGASFVDRCLRLSGSSGTVAIVSRQDWLYQRTSREFRTSLLHRRA